MLKVVTVETPAEYRAQPGDLVQIETQYDQSRGTVLYVHVNGATVLRIQGLTENSQLHPRNVIEMKGRD